MVQTNDEIYVDQDACIDELKHVNLKSDRASQKDELLSKEEIKSVTAIARQLLWMSSNIRPYIVSDSCAASNYGNSPTVKCILTANKAVDKVKRSILKLFLVLEILTCGKSEYTVMHCMQIYLLVLRWVDSWCLLKKMEEFLIFYGDQKS